MFQLIARHLLHTLNIIVVESFTTPHYYCPMSVQPLPALTVTNISLVHLAIVENKSIPHTSAVREPTIHKTAKEAAILAAIRFDFDRFWWDFESSFVSRSWRA